jgi:hypothetical protein
MRNYESPEIRDLGSLQELTAASNKIGPTADIFTSISEAVVGSLTGIQLP